MSKIGNFEGIDNLGSSKLSKKADMSSVPAEDDKKKLNTLQPQTQVNEKKMSDIKDMDDRRKIAFYRKNDMKSMADNRNAIMRRNEGNGENHRLTKLNSHNYDKLAQARDLDPGRAKNTKESFAKWSPSKAASPLVGRNQILQVPDRNHSVLTRHASEGEKAKITGNIGRNQILQVPDRNHSVLTRHASEGEKANITGNKSDVKIHPSGEFVAKGFPKTPDARKEDFALPSSNKAEIVRPVELARPQNIIVGQAGPQKQFEKGEDNIPRTGGGRQIVTDGGFGGRDINGSGTKEPALRYTDNHANSTDLKKDKQGVHISNNLYGK